MNIPFNVYITTTKEIRMQLRMERTAAEWIEALRLRTLRKELEWEVDRRKMQVTTTVSSGTVEIRLGDRGLFEAFNNYLSGECGNSDLAFGSFQFEPITETFWKMNLYPTHSLAVHIISP